VRNTVSPGLAPLAKAWATQNFDFVKKVAKALPGAQSDAMRIPTIATTHSD